MQRKGREKNSSLKKYIVADKYDGMTAESYVKEVMGVSSRNRQKLFFSKGVYVNGASVHTKRVIKAGDMVAIRQFRDTSYGVIPEEGTVDVLYEDNDVIVLNKPAGMLVHPAGQTQSGTLANYLAAYFKSKRKVLKIRPLHRLDRDTTGCVLFAKSGDMQTKLEEMLANGKVHRYYQAIICGSGQALQEKYPEGVIDLPIAKDPFQTNRRAVMKNGQRAVTHFTVEKEGEKHSLLSLWLETGRTHQIRVHLAQAGFPVLGDRMYGRRSSLIERQALHACALEFIHPVTGENISVKASGQQDFRDIVEKI